MIILGLLIGILVVVAEVVLLFLTGFAFPFLLLPVASIILVVIGIFGLQKLIFKYPKVFILLGFIAGIVSWVMLLVDKK